MEYEKRVAARKSAKMEVEKRKGFVAKIRKVEKGVQSVKWRGNACDARWR